MPTSAAERRVLLQFYPQTSLLFQLGLGTGFSQCRNLVGFHLHHCLQLVQYVYVMCGWTVVVHLEQDSSRMSLNSVNCGADKLLCYA